MAKIQECVCLDLTALGDSVREQDFLVSCSDSLNLPQTQIGIRISHKQLWHFGENSQTWRWKKIKISSTPICCVVLRKLLSSLVSIAHLQMDVPWVISVAFTTLNDSGLWPSARASVKLHTYCGRYAHLSICSWENDTLVSLDAFGKVNSFF